MGVAGDIALAAGGVLLVVAAPLQWAFSTLVCFWLLVPGSLWLPHAPHIVFVDRLVLYALASRLVVRNGQHGEPPAHKFAPTRVHLALFLLLVAGFIDGVALAPAPASLAGDIHGLLTLVDLLVLGVVVTSIARAIGPWMAATSIAAAAGVAATVGIGEWISGHGWSHFFFEHLPPDYLSFGADQLQRRGNAVRVQGAAQFALEYGWVTTALLPLACATVVHRWRDRCVLWKVTPVLPVLLVIAALASASRSAEIAMAGCLALFFVLARADRGARRILIGMLALFAAIALADPGMVTAAFTAGNADPASVRLDRLPFLFSAAARRPFAGTGFTGVVDLGGIDDTYAWLYATIGAVGLIAWCVLLATGLSAPARALRVPHGSDTRLLGAACCAGIAVIAVACATYDVASTTQSPWALVILACVGGTAGEEVVARHLAGHAGRAGILPDNPKGHPYQRLRRPIVAAVLGAITGTLVMALAPVAYSVTLRLVPVADWVETYNGEPVNSYTGQELSGTVCGLLSQRILVKGADVACLPGNSTAETGFPGAMDIAVRAGSRAVLGHEVDTLLTAVPSSVPVEGGAVAPVQSGKPAWATTAPLWIGTCGLGVAVVLPLRRDRRRAVTLQPELDRAIGGEL